MEIKFLSLLLFISALYSPLASSSLLQYDTQEFSTSTRWGAGGISNAGNSETVSWSYLDSGASTDNGSNVTLDTFMPAGFQAQIQSAFDAWTAIAGITFIQQANGSDSGITIGGHSFDGAFGTLAHANTAFFSSSKEIVSSDIHFDIDETWKIGFGGVGNDIFQVAAHEIGHAIGLGHTGVSSSLMNEFYSEAFTGPQADDIDGAVFLYGDVTAVPLPGAFWLMLCGLGLITKYRKKYA